MRVGMSMVALAALAAPAMAQQQQAVASNAPADGPSVQGYVCQFTGNCGGEPTTPAATMASGDVKGFKMAKAMPDKPAAAVIRPSGYVPPRPAVHGAAPVSYGRRQPAHVVTTPAATLVTGTRQPRADLMIGFERNSARISGQGMASAKIFAQALLTPDLSGKRFVIEGHTDTRGGRQLNMNLSAQRAQAVTEYLVSQGVDRSRLMSRGIGPDAPLPGHSPSDPSNRRVEAELLP